MNKKLVENLTVYDITNDLSKFKPERLLVYSIDTLLKNGIEPTFPYIVAACFKQYPGVFSLGSDFPEYPDSLKVQKYLDLMAPYLADNGTGNIRLNPEGKQVARDVSAEMLSLAKTQVLKEKKLNIVNSTQRNYSSLQLSKAYSQYLLDKVIDYDLLWDHFAANINVDRNVLKKVFREVNSYANMIGDKSIIQFTNEVIATLNKNV